MAEPRFLWSLGETQPNTNDLFGRASASHVEYLLLVELKLFCKIFGKNNLNNKFVIICVKIVRRNQEKPYLCGSGSSIEIAPTSLYLYKKLFIRCPFNRSSCKEPREPGTRAFANKDLI